jgi:hypothetical protein
MRKVLAALAAVAVALVVFVVPAGAITNGTPDGTAHPYVGELFFYVPDEIDPRFTDPGAWFSCSGTLVSPTVVLTAGHCTFGTGLNGTATSQSGGGGGNDVWVNFDEAPDFSGLPPSANYIPNGNAQRYTDRVAWLNSQPAWHRGTAHPHPQFDPVAFFLHDAGVVVLDAPVSLSQYGKVTSQGSLDRFAAKGGKNTALFDTVGYGLTLSRPKVELGGDTRLRATPKLIDLKGMFGLPPGTAAKFSNDNGGAHQGGTCSGDSGGPFLYGGTNEVVAVNSFGINGNCTGTDGAYRIDQPDDLAFLAGFGITPS